MRILHLIESLEFGGAEKVMIDLANELASRHDVTICCVKRLGALAASVDSRIHVHCLYKDEGNDFLLPFRLAGVLRRARIEVMHVHNWGIFLEGAVAAIFARTRVRLHTVHGPYPQYGPGWRPRLKCAARHWLERTFAPHFTKIVTVSDSIKEYVRNEIGIDASRLMTIHNGISIDAIPATRKNEDEIVCISVGRLAKIKNHEMMIRAFHAVDCSRARLWLVGDGPERNRLEALSHELALGDHVIFVGFCHDVAGLLARSNIFMMSSDYEGISIAVLEAMRAGLPIVGTRVGGMPETVRDGYNGILVGARDIEAMANAIRILIESPRECARLGASGRRFLEAEFSISTMVERYEQLYSIQTT